jgi:hypothetical protein
VPPCCPTYQDLVHIAPDDVHIRRDGPELVIGLAVTEVTRAEGLLDLARDQELGESRGQVGGPVRDVKVANHKDELGGRVDEHG